MIFSFLLAASAFASSPADAYIEKAKKLQLSERKEWARLLHYEKPIIGKVQSSAKGTRFFLSPKGSKDLAAEMDATIQNFYEQQPESKPEDPAYQAAQCQFPARLQWLKKELDLKGLPIHECARYAKFVKSLAARSVTLIFSSYYLNNPSSAFGHTLMRLNKAESARPGPGAELLDYGINFAAVTDTDNAVFYAFKGLLGFFQGTFASVPYYFKVREYNDYESRDLWEYDLNLTQAETDFLVAHLWEMGATHFDYFYLRQNCSYQLMLLLDVAKPELHLAGKLKVDVIPGDTVQVLNEEPGLVKAVHYRPSMRAKFEARLAKMDAKEKKALHRLLDSSDLSLAEFAPAAQAKILEAATEYVDQTEGDRLMAAEDSPGKQKKHALGMARARVDAPSEPVAVAPPLDKMPQLGHGSRRFRIGGGYSSKFQNYAILDYRFALHDLDDPLDGYPDYSQIEMFGGRLRYNVAQSRFWLDSLTLFRIVSLSPLREFDHKFSWMVDFGAKRFYDRICSGECFGPNLETGGGYAISSSRAFAAFLMAQAEVMASSGFTGSKFQLGFGPNLGLRIRPTNTLGISLLAGYRYRPLRGLHEASFFEGSVRWAGSKRFALDMQVRSYFPLLESSISAGFYY
jgi:hypothetical protein